MNKDYISTDALYGLDYLAHARTYSHKYIKREPDGHGGYRYYYKTDINMPNSNAHLNTYSKDSDGFTVATSYKQNGGFNGAVGGYRHYNKSTGQYFREADKAGQIYQEGLSQNEKDAAEKRAKIEAARRERQNSRNDKKTEDMMYQNEYENNTRSGWTDVNIDMNPLITYGPGNFQQTDHLARRKKNLSDTNQPAEVRRRGKGLGTGPVGYRPGGVTGQQIVSNAIAPVTNAKISEINSNSTFKAYVDAAKKWLSNIFN